MFNNLIFNTGCRRPAKQDASEEPVTMVHSKADVMHFKLRKLPRSVCYHRNPGWTARSVMFSRPCEMSMHDAPSPNWDGAQFIYSPEPAQR